MAQTASCPLNIDFETGTFNNWQCYTGSTTTSGSNNVITVSASAPILDRHTIVPKSSAIDPYGKFPVSPPDGSAYSVRLGNSGVGGQAERISYTFTVPANQNNFVLTYQYAVVFEDPGHAVQQQPRFTAKVLDVAANTYITCSSFNYVATSGLPGFKKSTVAGTGGSLDVYYKPWAPVTINLSGYQGRKITIEFTTADCTQGGHFGYAYIDINKSCTNAITGESYCSATAPFALTGPSGYDTYNWYNADRSKLLGTGNILTMPTPPADGTTVILDLVPFAGFGCTNTVSTVIHNRVINLLVTDPVPVCQPVTVDITGNNIFTIDDKLAAVSYWTDAAATYPLADPKAIAVSGVYYIKATNDVGCAEIKPVNVTVVPALNPVITNPTPVCSLDSVNITAPGIVGGGAVGLTFSYWSDATATVPLVNANAITTAGTYYIKIVNIAGCMVIKPVVVSFYQLPVLVINTPPAICAPSVMDITQQAITAGSDVNLSFSYWTDAAATQPLPNPTQINTSGTYYIKAVNSNGCQIIKPVTVVVNSLPQLAITNPPEICAPGSVDISAPSVTAGSVNVKTFTYWKDAGATVPLVNYTAITDSGQYYIKAVTAYGCQSIAPVTVTIHSQPRLKITNPAKIYQPFKIDLSSAAIVKGSSPGLTFSYYMDAAASVQVAEPSKIGTSGTYYIRAENKYGCFDIAPVEVIVALKPDIAVPTAFTPTQATNNRLGPFPVGIHQFSYFTVYNRWGNVVFHTTDPTASWDGTYKGTIAFLDTFTWVAEGYDELGKLVHRSGNTIILK